MSRRDRLSAQRPNRGHRGDRGDERHSGGHAGSARSDPGRRRSRSTDRSDDLRLPGLTRRWHGQRIRGRPGHTGSKQCPLHLRGQRGPRCDDRVGHQQAAIGADGVTSMVSWACGTARARASTDPVTHFGMQTPPGSITGAGFLRSPAMIRSCKSSTIASASEWALADLAMPTLYPGSVQEVLDYGRLGYELSRFSGAWVGFKIVTQRCRRLRNGRCRSRPVHVRARSISSGDTAELDTDRSVLTGTRTRDDGRPTRGRPSLRSGAGLDESSAPSSGDGRHRRRRHHLRRVRETRSARLGFRTDEDLSGQRHPALQAGHDLAARADQLGRFADGLAEIIVIEEKRSFIESQIRDLLYGRTGPPMVVGKRPWRGTASSSHWRPTGRRSLAIPCGLSLAQHVPARRLAAERSRIPRHHRRRACPSRAAHFCSGCPHNRSTVLPDGSMPMAASAATRCRLHGARGPRRHPHGRRRRAVGWHGPVRRRRAPLPVPG